MWAVDGFRPQHRERPGAGDAGQVDVHEDHLWLGRTRQCHPEASVLRAQQPQVLAARDELLDQLQVGRVVLHVQHGAYPRGLRPAPPAAVLPVQQAQLQQVVDPGQHLDGV